MSDDEVEFITPPNKLQSKVTMSAGGVDPATLARAEAVIASLQGNYLQWVEDDLTNLQGAYERAMSDPSNRRVHISEIFRIAHDVKGQGGSFGYQLMTVIATYLCRMVEKIENPGPEHMAVIKLHIDALRLVITQRMEGTGGAAGESLVKGLEAVIGKISR
ncbi:MAG: Hpt domain-containing protein [Alphaproteobacteria bacterium]|nr:Hpt domain-containing protein [Alphaproteobacteria bacterium]